MDIRQPQRNIRSEQGRDDITASWTLYKNRPRRIDTIRDIFNRNANPNRQEYARGFGTKGE